MTSTRTLQLASSRAQPIVVLANGVFDILHIGHLLYLEAAAKMGDILVVSITADAFVNKGPGRPMFPEAQRAKMVGALKCVDRTIIVNSALEALETVKPDIFVKGPDYIGNIQTIHADYCRNHGIEIRFTDTPIYSATKIINDRLGFG